MYLLDTNIWLERLLNQAKAPEVKQLLDTLDSSELALSDFSLHSICVILGRSRKLALLDQFIADLFLQGRVALLNISAADVPTVTVAMQAHRLDFDDAYQYVLAKRNNLSLISFDPDFDRTDLPRQTPAQVLAARPAPPPGSQT
jgi:predicted nucleic acid-binding protein